MNTCAYFEFLHGGRSPRALTRFVVVACALSAVLLVLLSLFTIGLRDVDIEHHLRLRTVLNNSTRLVAVNNSTISSHFFAREVESRDAGGNGANGNSNVFLIAIIVLLFVLIVCATLLIVFLCCRCRRDACKTPRCCRFLCLIDSENRRRRRARQPESGRDTVIELEAEEGLLELESVGSESEDEDEDEE